MTTSIKLTRSYPHPVNKLWRALTEPDLLERWLMPNDFKPLVGHQFTFRTEPAPGFDGIVHCEVLELEPLKLLKFSWRGGPIDTVVTFELTELESGTRLCFRQTGFVGMKGWLVGRMLRLGFRKMYVKLLPKVLREIDQPTLTDQGFESNECRGMTKRVFEFVLRKK